MMYQVQRWNDVGEFVVIHNYNDFIKAVELAVYWQNNTNYVMRIVPYV
jgi:hypothetical protein